MCCAVACLCGVYAAGAYADAYGLAFGLCAALFVLCVVRLCMRRSALLCAMLAMLTLGYGLAGARLCARDEATRYGVLLTGRVSRIISGTRVILTDVTADEDGTTRLLRFPAAVTLMLEEDETREVYVGQRVEGTGRLFEQETPRNPGETDNRVQAICDGYELSGYILPGWTATGEKTFSLWECFRRAREWAVKHLSCVFGEDAPLYQAILLGEKGDMEWDVVRSMRLTGTAHILTVSGMHLSLIALALNKLLSRMRRRWRCPLKILALGMFTLLTGCAPGTVRAFVMASLSTLATWRGRQYDPLTGISAAALFETLLCPVWPLQGAFQFSFFVTLGILLLHGRIDRFLSRHCPRALRVRPLLSMLSVSVSAQLSALPIQLLFYGTVPLLSLPMNLLGGLLMPVLMAVGAFCGTVGAFSLKAGMACAAVLGVPGRLFEHLNVACADMPWSNLRLPAPYVVTVALAALLMALFSDQFLFRRRPVRLRAVVAAVIALLYIVRFDPTARYVQLDVGQGDAAVLRSGRHAVLVDVGPQDSASALRYLRHEGLLVDLLVLSHLDEDHAGALSSLLSSEIDIGALAMAEGALDDVGSQDVVLALEQADQMGISRMMLERGDHVYVNGMCLDVLSPNAFLSGSNERSLVLFTTMDGVRILTTGDLPIDSEMETWPDCDLLKVAHHGSKNATSAQMLEQTTPEVALISVGAHNSYGHPTQRVLDDLAAVGADIYRTDQGGCVTVWLRDGRWRVCTAVLPQDRGPDAAN